MGYSALCLTIITHNTWEKYVRCKILFNSITVHNDRKYSHFQHYLIVAVKAKNKNPHIETIHIFKKILAFEF